MYARPQLYGFLGIDFLGYTFISVRDTRDKARQRNACTVAPPMSATVLLPPSLAEQSLPPPRSNRFHLLPRLSGGAILGLLCMINFFNYVDRMIVAGAPIEFGQFISETLDVPAHKQAFFLGIITPAFMVTFSAASIIFGHLVHHVSPFRLMSCGCSVWVFALACSGAAYYLPKSPSTFWFFLTARALSGVGEASFQCFVPAYVEDFAPEGSRALWLAILYAPIPIGSALGLGIGATFAPAPPRSSGWGAAYLLEALLMLPCAIGLGWLPTAKEIRRRRRRAAALRRVAQARRALAAASTPNPSSGTLPLLGRVHGNAHPSGAPWSPDSFSQASEHPPPLQQPHQQQQAPPPPSDMMPPVKGRNAHATHSAPLPQVLTCASERTDVLTDEAEHQRRAHAVAIGICHSPVLRPRGLPDDGGGDEGDRRQGGGESRRGEGGGGGGALPSPSSAAAASPSPTPHLAPSVCAQMVFLVTSPSYMCIALGYAAFTATVMGISTFAPLCLMALGLFEHQKTASNVFGLVCAVAGILGAPLGGRLTDYAVAFALPKSSSRREDALQRGEGTGGPLTASGELREAASSLGDLSDDVDSRGQLPAFAHDESVTAQWIDKLKEARALVISITLMIFASALLCIASIVVLYGGPQYKLLFLALAALYVTFSFATSAGITRSVMLLVPNNVRPFALGFLTLVLHALGDVPSPPVVGILLGAWAANCSIVDINTTSGAIEPHGGPGTEPAINPHCWGAGGPSTGSAVFQEERGSGITGFMFMANHSYVYSRGQYGILSVLMLASCYMLTAVMWWGSCILVLSRRIKTECAQPQPPSGPCCRAPHNAALVETAAVQTTSVRVVSAE